MFTRCAVQAFVSALCSVIPAPLQADVMFLLCSRTFRMEPNRFWAINYNTRFFEPNRRFLVRRALVTIWLRNGFACIAPLKKCPIQLKRLSLRVAPFATLGLIFCTPHAGDSYLGGIMLDTSKIYETFIGQRTRYSVQYQRRLKWSFTSLRSIFALAAFAITLLGATAFNVPPVAAQAIPQSLQSPETQGSQEDAIRKAKNAWTVGIVGGLFSGTYMRFAVELAQALDDGENLRILPIVSAGAASNLDDLLYLRGIDLAITQSDVFAYFQKVRKTPNLSQRVNYIIRLPLSELHILARNEIHSIKDLEGKTVNFGPVGSASSLTGAITFQRLGIKVKQTNLSYPVALKKLNSGEISALIRTVGKPVDGLRRIPKDSGFHLLSIPFSKKFADYYTLGEFSHKDYPNLIPAGQSIDTIAVPAVLAVYNWPRDTGRYRKVKRFVERLFENWDKFQHPPYHPKWRDVNLAATVPGWHRFSVAKQMLRRLAESQAANQQALKRQFQSYLSQNRPNAQPKNDAERDMLFQQFLSWLRTHGDTTK